MSTSRTPHCKDGASKANDDCVSNVNEMLQSTSNANSKKEDDKSFCANCGKVEEESHKLKACTACRMVKYCNRACQIAHRPQHKKECKKHAAELHDEELFKQPPPAEDCPICFIRLPSQKSGSQYASCCGKVICNGCFYAPLYDDQGNEVDNEKCPFCRTPYPATDEEVNKRCEKRLEMKDPIAMFNIGCDYHYSTNGYPQDYTKAFELLRQAGELGYVEAYFYIGSAYYNGEGVEIDKKKAINYFELAAMRGSATARVELGMEEKANNMDRAMKHFMIAVRGGHTESFKLIQNLYTDGHATKDDYTKALQSYQEYLSEIKSVQRDKAAALDEEYRYY